MPCGSRLVPCGYTIYAAVAATAAALTHLKAIVGPGAKLHLATLIVEGEPGDVDFARGLEDAGRHVEAAAIVTHHHVGGIGAVEALVGAASEVATHFLVSNGQGN